MTILCRTLIPIWFLLVGMAGMWLPTTGAVAAVLLFAGLAVVLPMVMVSIDFWRPEALRLLKHANRYRSPSNRVHNLIVPTLTPKNQP